MVWEREVDRQHVQVKLDEAELLKELQAQQAELILQWRQRCWCF